MKYSFFILILSCLISKSQTLSTYDVSGFLNNSYYSITSYDEVHVYSNARIINNVKYNIKAGEEILISPNTDISGFTPNGYFYGKIEPNELEVVSFHQNGWWGIPRYDKFEIGMKIPSNIQTQIDAFLNGGTGLNPYDPDQVKVECTYNGAFGSFTRYGFYYRDFITQNNEWIEQPNDYKFRIRFAPPNVYTWSVTVNLFINGILNASVTHPFSVNVSGNPGHLKIAANNLRKLQFTNGNSFYALGQGIGFSLPSEQSNCASNPSGCFSPYSFQKQRDFIADLANNGGNFVRFRLDALNGLIEWPHQQMTINDPPINTKPLSSYLNNYDEPQRYLSEIDKTFTLMEGTDMYCMLNLLPDQNFTLDNVYDEAGNLTWNQNPYNTITGNNLTGCKAFFTNQQSINTYRKWLFYIAARFGYSTRLGIWEMINETSGVAGSFGAANPYETDASFANDVNNWTCDMKYYLEQFYPWHPTTSGNVGDAKLPYPNCLNIWSSNEYSGFIMTAQDQPNHNKYNDSNKGRFDVSRFFENNNRPFIFGELGLGDAMNFVDKYNDREFHTIPYGLQVWEAVLAQVYIGMIGNKAVA